MGGTAGILRFRTTVGAKKGRYEFDIAPMPQLTVPHGLLLEPYDYQKEGIAYALAHKRCIFGDQPGLGKTLQAIGTVTIANPIRALLYVRQHLK